MREQIDDMAREAEFGTAGEHQEILETYRMFAYDEGWSRRIGLAIDSGLTAEAAIERVQQRTRARIVKSTIPCFRSGCMIWRICRTGCCASFPGGWTAAQTGLAHDVVLIARNLGPPSCSNMIAAGSRRCC